MKEEVWIRITWTAYLLAEITGWGWLWRVKSWAWHKTISVIALTFVAMFFAATAYGSSPLGLVNSERAAAGLSALTEDPALSSYAASHASAMASNGDIYHSSSAALQTAPSQPWTKLGENVGRGGSITSLHEAFMDSAAHRANILGAYTHVGYAYTTLDGVTYTAWVFAAYESKPKSTTTTTTTNAHAPRIDGTPEAEPRDTRTRPYLRARAYPL